MTNYDGARQACCDCDYIVGNLSYIFSHQVIFKTCLGIFSMLLSLSLYFWLEDPQSPSLLEGGLINIVNTFKLDIVFFYLKLVRSSQARQSNSVLLVI